MYVTIHESDDEAFELWCEHIESSRIKRMGDKDNFWQMGDTGPCGPCSEIYVDQGAEFFHSEEDYFGGEGDRFLEIWNLVFMQYERDSSGALKPLPKPSIDTGMGLERVIALKEGEINNFDSSLFAPIMQCIKELTGKSYYRDSVLLKNTMGFAKDIIDSCKKDIASFRVIADHARSVAFLLAQGVNFDKEGRGYVLRRILRRAVRHGYLLGLRKAFLYEVVGVVCDTMGGHYSYLIERKNALQEQCKAEEERFFETIESGMALFQTELDSMRQKNEKSFNGEIAFKLYDTYGFPLDLTQDMLRELGLSIDLQGFEKCMQEQKDRSKAHWKGSGDSVKDGDFNALLSEFGKNEFVGYERINTESKILALLDSSFKRIESLEAGQEGWVMLESTPFYPESGGPVGDKGVLFSLGHSVLSDKSRIASAEATALTPSKLLASASQNHDFSSQSLECQDSSKVDSSSPQNIIAKVLDTQKYFGLNLSKVVAASMLKVGDLVKAQVDSSRFEIAKHHSATHLLHYALRQILGSHIAQAGSLVEANRLRFDFSHPKALSVNELEQIEALVNEKITESAPQVCETMGIEQAKAKGAMALFGEKYGESVRVITLGDSIELCGGIHIHNTAEIGSFYIVRESSVSSGVRRIEAVCGKAAYHYGKATLDSIKTLKEQLKAQDVLQGVAKLQIALKEARESANKAKQSVKSLDYEEINGVKLIVLKLDSVEAKEAKDIIDRAKNENEKVAILLVTESGGKVSLTAGVKGVSSLKAGAWVKQVAQILGGNGGGRDDFATAGGKITESSKVQEALDLAKSIAREKLD